ncbi:MAG: hypothetical protein IKI57_05265 [Clostridia bacterium]|nr:hypothetical protein [Clostridia bacterium]
MFVADLLNDDKWIEFLNYKLDKDYVSKHEKKQIKDFVLNKQYKTICNFISKNEYSFSIPRKHLISKGRSSKKRAVYTFNNDEMIILKYISYLLYEYDNLFARNLYSFRKSFGVKSAINNICNIKNISKMYGYKVDISNYFNSININILLDNLKEDIKDDGLYNLLYELLSNNKVKYNDEIIVEEKGVMAGVPISAFLANYYIKEIDDYFWNQKLVYLRYADDIIMFCNDKEELIRNQQMLLSFFKKYKLKINKEKEYFFEPQENWDFLGFSFCNDKVDLSLNSVKKIKAKIRRSARSIRRWMLKNNTPPEAALKAMNKKYNRKFYGKLDSDDLSWKYWFFPTITTTKSLKEIDNYMQECMRYMITGKHNKRNYEVVPYTLIKSCNYRPLVHEYYKFLSFDMKNDI